MKKRNNRVERCAKMQQTTNPYPHVGQGAALPFIKWVGGKRALIPRLTPYFPDKIETYWEPFLGGGSVFFTFANRIGQAILSDTNEDLLITYQMVKEQVEDLIDQLQVLEANHNQYKGKKYEKEKTYYQYIRESNPNAPLDIAARFIYLNKTCFNGLYRVNRKGIFNVPEGRYKNPDICNSLRLKQASTALSNAIIQQGDFAKVVTPNEGDLVYCDPPYDGCFTSYQAEGFNGNSQSRLCKEASTWANMGAKVILSNADTKTMRSLYNDWSIESVTAPRSINSNGNGRQPVGELVISK